MSTFFRCALGSMLAGALLSCATSRGHRVGDDDVPPPDIGPTAEQQRALTQPKTASAANWEQEKAKQPPPHAKNVNEHASTFRTGQLCELDARALVSSDPSYAWDLLSLCTRRRDFTDLHRLFAAPWREKITHGGVESLKIVAGVIAHRGGNPELDLVLCNDNGLQIFPLDDAINNPGAFRGRYVLMRGRVVEDRAQARARRLVIAETTLRSQNLKSRGRGYGSYSYDSSTRSWQRRGDTMNVAKATGNQVTGVFGGSLPPVEKPGEYLFLMRFEGVRADPPDVVFEEGEGEPRSIDAAIVDAVPVPE